jgi:SAM-dependent methyltransferase
MIGNRDRRAARFFDAYADTFDSLYDGRRTPFWRWIDQRFRSDMYIRYLWTFERLREFAGRSVLDIGCGSGPYLLEALKRGARVVTGLDPAPQMLALARSRLEVAGVADRARLVEGYFPDARLEPHEYGIVMGVMDYVEHPEAFLAALPNAVRTAVVLSFPSRHWLRTPIRAVRYRLRRCPVYFYDEEQIRRLVSVAGFPQVDVRKIPGAGMDYHVCLSRPDGIPPSSR